MSSGSSDAANNNYGALKSQVSCKELELRLARATTSEESLKLAIEAAELALRAIKSAVTKTEQVEMKARASHLLRQAEGFKKQAADSRSEGTLPIRSRTPVSSTSTSSTGRGTTPSSYAGSLSTGATSASRTTSTSLRTPAQKSRSPRSRRELTKAEQILLMRGSKLNGCKFPPWAAIPNSHDFVLEKDAPLFTDELELRLSEEQLQYLDDWKRATDAVPPPTWFPGDRSLLGPSMERNLPTVDLVQDATTDCSVVASMCACIARSSRGHPKLLGGLIFPWDNDMQQPILSPNGKYIIKLNFNGCWRRVMIDDRLPVSKTKRVLHVVDRKNPQLLWPALVEKAYLKVRGGYDFPGSNSGTDLWIITGWIPEQVFLQDSDTDLSDIWKCMIRGWDEGNVLVTMGTGQISQKAERVDGLASQHDYAVLDLYDDGEHQLIQLKNPWREGRSWTGRIPGLEGVDESYLDGESLERRRRLKALCDEPLPPGTFWIPWNDVHQHFESIYCNWNPSMFTYREDIHFSWDLRTKRGATGSFANNPQFSITGQGAGEIWLLLSRHFQDASSASPGDEENVSIDASGVMQGHINLYLYNERGKRQYISSPPCARGHYVDAPQVLCRADLPSARTITAVVSEQGLPDIRQNFSLVVFAKMPIELEMARDPYPHSTVLSSAWTSTSSGGRSGALTFYSNPMFVVQIRRKASLALLLTTAVAELNINLKLVHSNGSRIQTLNNRDIIVDSGDYRRGSAFAQAIDLDAGSYTIICSTFEPGQKAPFTLRVDGSDPPALKQLPPQHAGRIAKRLPGVHFAPSIHRLGARLMPKRHSIFSAAVTNYSSAPNATNDSRIPVRLSMVVNPGPNERVVCVSNEGEFSDGRTAAVQLPEVNVWAGMAGAENMWVMVERMGGAGEDSGSGEFGVDVLCDGRVDDCVDVGEWRVFEE